MISATSPNQEGVEGIDSRSGLDTHRDIGHTSHVYLLVGNSFVLPHQGGTFLSWFATGYISLRNSWAERRHATAVLKKTSGCKDQNVSPSWLRLWMSWSLMPFLMPFV